jgi:tetratricopeptide (TPR) repeat protein
MNHKNAIKTILTILLVFLLTHCAAERKPEVTTQELVQYNKIIQQADALYERGCYVCLKQAFRLYEEALTFPVFQKKNSEKLLKTAILLGLRERELGILEEIYFLKAQAIMDAFPSLAEHSVLMQIASTIPRKTVGVVGDFIETGDRVIVSLDEVEADLESWKKFLNQKSELEDIYAYLKISFFSAFSYFIKQELETDSIEQVFPDSPLIRYKLALLPKANPLDLEQLAQDDPQFYEAFFFLGQKALKLGLLVTAEKNFLKAYQGIPHSSSLVISMASIYFAFEELEKSLEFYEKTLGVAPAHRDALLGKAMCLGYLGRYKEAIQVCNKIINLGKYYLGESHYWLAWNLNELEQWENAWLKIETSKKYLIGHGEVFFLAGLIAFNQKNLDEAEKNLLEAHKQDDSNGDPAYYLGKIKNLQEDWLNAGAYFESASRRYGIKENMIREKILAIKDSAFSEERKKKHLKRKTNQLKKMELTKATSWYNAAAGFYNAGYPKKAIQLAEKATSHTSLKEKAQELLQIIKK